MPTIPPTLTPAPTPYPVRADAATFSDRVDARNTWEAVSLPEKVALGANVYNNAVEAFNSATAAAAYSAVATAKEASAAASALTALNAPGTAATSTTSLTVGLGSQSMTIQTGKSIVPSMFLVIGDSAAPATNYMIGQVTSYNSVTGALVVSVSKFSGTGTMAAWTVSLTAAPSNVAEIHASALYF